MMCIGVIGGQEGKPKFRQRPSWCAGGGTHLSWTRDLSGEGTCSIQLSPLKHSKADHPQQTRPCPSTDNLSSHQHPGRHRQEYSPGPLGILAGITEHVFSLFIDSNMHIFHTLFMSMTMHQGPCQAVFPERKNNNTDYLIFWFTYLTRLQSFILVT